jgi:hypothetical protein
MTIFSILTFFTRMVRLRQQTISRCCEYCPFKALLNCDVRGQGGCRGGHVDQAWHYTRRHG